MCKVFLLVTLSNSALIAPTLDSPDGNGNLQFSQKHPKQFADSNVYLSLMPEKQHSALFLDAEFISMVKVL